MSTLQEGWDGSEQRRRSIEAHREAVLEAGQFQERLHLRNRRGEFTDMPGGTVKASLLKGTGHPGPVGFEGSHEGRPYQSLYPRLYRVRYKALKPHGGGTYDVDKVIGATDEHHARAQASRVPGAGIIGRVTATHVSTMKPRTPPAEQHGQRSLFGPITAQQRNSADRAIDAQRSIVRGMDRRYHAAQKAKAKKAARAAATRDPNEAGWVKALRRQDAAAAPITRSLKTTAEISADYDRGQRAGPHPQTLPEPGHARRMAAADGTLPNLKSMPLYEMANVIRRDWKNPYFGAVPYLQALGAMESHDDNYGADSGRSIVAYFLSNARAWRGPVAKQVKAELKRRMNAPRRRG